MRQMCMTDSARSVMKIRFGIGEFGSMCCQVYGTATHKAVALARKLMILVKAVWGGRSMLMCLEHSFVHSLPYLRMLLSSLCI